LRELLVDNFFLKRLEEEEKEEKEEKEEEKEEEEEEEEARESLFVRRLSGSKRKHGRHARAIPALSALDTQLGLITCLAKTPFVHAAALLLQGRVQGRAAVHGEPPRQPQTSARQCLTLPALPASASASGRGPSPLPALPASASAGGRGPSPLPRDEASARGPMENMVREKYLRGNMTLAEYSAELEQARQMDSEERQDAFMTL